MSCFWGFFDSFLLKLFVIEVSAGLGWKGKRRKIINLVEIFKMFDLLFMSKKEGRKEEIFAAFKLQHLHICKPVTL